MKNLRVSLLFLLFIVFLAGCCGCGYKDIDKRFFVIAIGLDAAEEGMVKLSLQVALPTPQPKNLQPEFQIFSETGKNLPEAVRKIKSQTGRELEFGQTQLVIFGMKLAEKDISLVWDWLYRRRDFQQGIFFAAGTPDAEHLLAFKLKSSRFPSSPLFYELNREGSNTNYAVTAKLYTFYRDYRERGISPVLPIVGMVKDHIIVQKAVVFQKGPPFKVKLKLNPSETQIHNLITNERGNQNITVDIDGIDYSISLNQVSVSTSMKHADDLHKIVMKVKANGILEGGNINFGYSQIPLLERKAEEKLQQQIMQYLVKVQKAQLDTVGFGLQYRAVHMSSKDWEKWGEIYPDASFEVHTKIGVDNLGLLKGNENETFD